MDHGCRLDADRHIVRLMMRSLEKMYVVSRNEWNSKSLRHLDQGAIAQVLRFDPVIVQVDIEVFFAENLAKFAGRFFPPS